MYVAATRINRSAQTEQVRKSQNMVMIWLRKAALARSCPSNSEKILKWERIRTLHRAAGGFRQPLWIPLGALPSSALEYDYGKQQQEYTRDFPYQKRGEGWFNDFIWNIQKPTKGTGFDNFIRQDSHENRSIDRKEGPTPNSSDEKDSSRDEKKKKEQKDNNNDNNNNSNNNGQSFLGDLLFFGAMAVALKLVWDRNREESKAQQQEQSNSFQQRDISWHELLQLLQQQDVVKIVISDTEADTSGSGALQQRPMARVYVKHNAAGLKQQQQQQAVAGFGGKTRDYQTKSLAMQPAAAVAGSNSNSNAAMISQGLHHDSDGTIDIVSFTGADSSISIAGSNSTDQQDQLPFYRMPISQSSLDAFERQLEDAQRALGRDPGSDVPIQYMAERTLSRELLSIVPGLVMAAVLFGLIRFAGNSMMRGGGGMGAGGGSGGGMGGIFQFGKSNAKKIGKEEVSVTFANVAGCDEAKKEIMEFVDFLKDAEPFTKLGAKIPKGALLCGPPGTGKTLLAKAVAGEAGVPFYTISGSDFIEMFVGVGPSRVRDLFADARKDAPCIIFIDEIDAVGRQRGRGGVGGNDERENTLNQLLVEMDGFDTTTGVVVLAGTNRVDILDQALTRPGRFDRQITVDKPDLKGRQEIFRVHLDGITLEDNVEDIAGRLAGLTPGFAGADIANICNEAAIVAARRKAETVSLEDFEKATDRVIGGLESNKIMSKHERSIVAHHEAGHAVAGWFLQHADPLLKVTIIPRSSGALGFAQYLPKEVFLRTEDQIMDIVCMALAGRASEEIFFGRVTTGASDDLKRVTQLVYSTIQLYGMNSRLGQLSFPKDPNAFVEDRPYSEKTAKTMDEEAKRIVDEAYQRTLSLLREKKKELETVANMLLDKETITHDDLIDAIGPRPFPGDPAYQEYVSRRKKEKPAGARADSTTTDDDSTSSAPVNPGLA